MKTVGAFGAFAGTSLIGLLATEGGGYRGSTAVLSCSLLLGGVLSIGFPEPGKSVWCASEACAAHNLDLRFGQLYKAPCSNCTMCGALCCLAVLPCR